MANPRDRDILKEKADQAVQDFKNRIEPNIVGKGANALKEYIEKLVGEHMKKLSEKVEEELAKTKDAVSIYTNVAKDVEKRQTALEAKIQGAIAVLKFLFGGGMLLTIINIVVMILIAVFK